jgi:hypothetical protein
LFLSQLPGASIFQCREAKQYCHSYYDAYRGGAIVQQGVAQLPSGNTARLNGKALAELMCARRSSRRARMKLTNSLTSFRSETQIGNRLLRSRLGRRRVLLSDADRRTLATLAKEIGTEALRALDPPVSPATLLRWHRQLVAQKWTFLEARRPGRPRTKIDVEQLVVRMARENPGWGYTRIHGALRNLDIKVGRGTIRRILKDHLIEPAPARGRPT